MKPILQVGVDGVTDAFLRSVEEAFHTRELLKVKVLDGAGERAREAGDVIMKRIPGVEVVQTIGRTVALYRAFAEEPGIELPR